jgi:hypothetical protein
MLSNITGEQRSVSAERTLRVGAACPQDLRAASPIGEAKVILFLKRVFYTLLLRLLLNQ